MAEKIGDIIRARAEGLGIKQKKLAEALSISQKTIKSIYDATTIQTVRLETLCDLLDYNFFDFFTRSGSHLEKFGHEACDNIRTENEELKKRIATLENEIAYAAAEKQSQASLMRIMQSTLEMQESYIKALAERKIGK